MPLAERGVLSLKTVNAEDSPVDILALRWPARGHNWSMALPLRVCATGVILGVPKDVFTEDELHNGLMAEEDALLGANYVVRVSISSAEEAEVEVAMVEFTMAIRQQLEIRTARSRRVVRGFTENAQDLPSIAELNEQVVAWLETGAARAEDYVTALEEGEPLTASENSLLDELRKIQTMMDRRFELVESQIGVLQAHRKPEAPPPPLRLGGIPKQPGVGLPSSEGVREEIMQDAIGNAQQMVGRRPPKLPDEPGRGPDTAVDLTTLPELEPEALTAGASMDDVVKLQMLKILKDMQAKNKPKTRKLPGLPNWADSDSSQGELETWSSSSKGGRGIEAVEKVKHAMKSHPEPYQERMEQRMMKAVDVNEMTPEVPLKFVKGTPVGKSKTAGYCLQGFAEVHRLLLENKPKQARLHVLRMMSALEQFLIDESWVVASRLMCTEEPPWGHWATQDVGAIRRQLVYNRLSESTWVAALINQLKEEEWLTKKRGNLQQPSKGGGKGKSKDKEKEPPTEN